MPAIPRIRSDRRVPQRALRLCSVVLLLALASALALNFAIPRNVVRAATRTGADTIVLVHGFSGYQDYGSFNGPGCGLPPGGGTFGNVVNYLTQPHDINGQQRTWGRQDFRGLQYYKYDAKCGHYGNNYPGNIPLTGGGACTVDCENLHNPIYGNRCNNYRPFGISADWDGSNNESIYHLSCLLAWYLYLDFDPNWNVEIVAHSMGGLIIRNAIYQVVQHKDPSMPPSLPHISDVVTFATPHGGAPAGIFCANCQQGKEMTQYSYFMNEMANSAQNPQAPGGTDWTMMGSECDSVNAGSATYMDQGEKIIFSSSGYNQSQGICYDHGGYLNDGNDGDLADTRWCDGCGRQPMQWNTWNSSPRSLHRMMYGLWKSPDSLRGRSNLVQNAGFNLPGFFPTPWQLMPST
ncbi:MAG TPA: hypothetical protein VGP82_01905, partial [Ktedonobacterales bacterium]|nr:hypothetical protein [Ktedonobacterales bacterium]